MQKHTITSTHTTSSTPRLPRSVIIIVLVLFILGLTVTVPSQSNWWKVIILGVVQGLTEFLPISSTGHLLIMSDLLDFENSIGGTFEIFIQLGTVLAVIAFYAGDLLHQARGVFGIGVNTTEAKVIQRFWLNIGIAFIPSAIIGFMLRKVIKTLLFESPQLIATSLILGGFIFILIELFPRRSILTNDIQHITLPQTLGIGFAQVLALIPGVSRSGSSIVGGLFAGLDRPTATKFSFYLAIPTLGAATIVDLISSVNEINVDDWGRLLLGSTVAMIIGWLSINWLLRYVAQHTFIGFGIYRISIGLLIFTLTLIGWL